MYFQKARVYQVRGTLAYFQIGDDKGNPIIAKIDLGHKSDKAIQAHKLAEMPIDFFLRYEEPTLKDIVKRFIKNKATFQELKMAVRQ